MASTDPDDNGERRTEQLWSRARAVLGSGLWSVTQGAFRYSDGLFPLLAESGEGCHLIDTTGRSYVAWVMGWGTSVLGYRHPAVETTTEEEIEC